HHREEERRGDEQDRTDRTFDEERDSRDAPEKDREAPSSIASIGEQKPREAPYAERDRGGEKHVRIGELAAHQDVYRAQLGEARDEAERAPELPSAEVGHKDRDRQRSDDAGQSRRPFGLAPEGR